MSAATITAPIAAPIIPTQPELCFEYGSLSVSDIEVVTKPHPTKPGRSVVDHLLVNDEAVEPTERFWISLYVRFSEYGVGKNLSNLFDHSEIFARLSERAANDRLRYTIERRRNRAPVLLAVTSPEKPIIAYDQLIDILNRFGGEKVTYYDGMVNSIHTPRIGSTDYQVPCPYGLEETHSFRNRFLLEVAIDGYGKPAVYPSLERLEDGVQFVTRQASALKTELNIGKGMDVVQHAVCRALDSFNTDEGFASLRNRIELGRRSWASLNEANVGYKLLTKQLSRGCVLGASRGKEEQDAAPVIMEFHEMTGDTSRIYGMASLDALATKRQQNLPVGATIYTLMAFFAELATYRATEAGRQAFHSFVGQRIGQPPYDMEGTRDKWNRFNEFRIHANLRGLPTIADPE